MNRYLWCYTLPDLQDEQIQEFKSHIVGKLGITDIFLSMGSSFQPDESKATGWWYENRTYASILYLGQYLNAIVPMAYNTAQEPIGGNFERLKTKLPFDQWQQKSPAKSGVIIGLGIYEYGSYDLIVETAESLEVFMSAEFSHNFKGIAFYSTRFLKM